MTICVKQDARPGDISYYGGSASDTFPFVSFPAAKIKLTIEYVPFMRRGNQVIGWIFEERGEKFFYGAADSPIAISAGLAEWITSELKKA